MNLKPLLGHFIEEPVMLTAEFEAKVENGKITIPEQYQAVFQQSENIKVILLKSDLEADLRLDEDTDNSTAEDIIQHLLDNPLSIENFVPASREDLHER